LSDKRVYRNEFVKIYDGKKVIDLDHDIDDYGALPKKFLCLTNKVPINYWKDTQSCKMINTRPVGFPHKPYIPRKLPHKPYIPRKLLHESGIAHNDIIWIDFRPFLDECFQNLIFNKRRYNRYLNENIFISFIYSHVTFQNTTYYIFFGPELDDEDPDELLLQIKEYYRPDKPIPVNFRTEDPKIYGLDCAQEQMLFVYGWEKYLPMLKGNSDSEDTDCEHSYDGGICMGCGEKSLCELCEKNVWDTRCDICDSGRVCDECYKLCECGQTYCKACGECDCNN